MCVLNRELSVRNRTANYLGNRRERPEPELKKLCNRFCKQTRVENFGSVKTTFYVVIYCIVTVSLLYYAEGVPQALFMHC